MLAQLDPLFYGPTIAAVATVIAARYAYLAVRRAAPAVAAEVPELEPRLSDVERQQLGWTRLLDYYEEHEQSLLAKVDRLEAENASLRAELLAVRHPPTG